MKSQLKIPLSNYYVILSEYCTDIYTILAAAAMRENLKITNDRISIMFAKRPRGDPGVKSRMCPPYPHACRKRRLKWGGFSK